MMAEAEYETELPAYLFCGPGIPFHLRLLADVRQCHPPHSQEHLSSGGNVDRRGHGDGQRAGPYAPAPVRHAVRQAAYALGPADAVYSGGNRAGRCLHDPSACHG